LTPITITIITPIASPTPPRSPLSIAAPTNDPIPGRWYLWLPTEIASEATRKNQLPPKLIIPFHTRPIAPLGTSIFQNRCHLVSRSERESSSSSRGRVFSDW
jgi:hypothetical protein